MTLFTSMSASHITPSYYTSSSASSSTTTLMPSSSSSNTTTMASSTTAQFLPPFNPTVYAGHKRLASCDAPNTPSSKRHRPSGDFRPRISSCPKGVRRSGVAFNNQRYDLPPNFSLGKRLRTLEDEGVGSGLKARITGHSMNVRILTKTGVVEEKQSVPASPRHLKPCSPRLPIFLRRSIRRQNKSAFRLRQPRTQPEAKITSESMVINIPSVNDTESPVVEVAEDAKPVETIVEEEPKVESKAEPKVEQAKDEIKEEVMQIVSSPVASEPSSPKPIEVEAKSEEKPKVTQPKKEKDNSIIGTLKNFKDKVTKASSKIKLGNWSKSKKEKVNDKKSLASSDVMEVEKKKKKSEDRIEEETEDDDDAKTIVLVKKSKGKSSLRLRLSKSSKKKDVRDLFSSSDEKEAEEPKKSSRRVTPTPVPVPVPASPTDAVMRDLDEGSEHETDKSEETEEEKPKKKKKRSTRKQEEEEEKPKKKKKKVLEPVESESENEEDEAKDKKSSPKSDTSDESIKDVDMLSSEIIIDAKDDDKSDVFSVVSMDIDDNKTIKADEIEEDDDDSKTIRGKESDEDSEPSKTSVANDSKSKSFKSSKSSKSSKTTVDDDDNTEESNNDDKKRKDDDDEGEESASSEPKSKSDNEEENSSDSKVVVDEKSDNTPHSPTHPRLSISIQVVPAPQAPADVLTPPPTPPLGSPKVSDMSHQIAWSVNFSSTKLDETLDLSNLDLQSLSDKVVANGKSLRSRLSRIFSQTLKRNNCDHFNPLNISRHAYRDSFARDREDDEETEFDDAMSFKTLGQPSPSLELDFNFVPFQAPMESCVELMEQFTMAY